MDTNLTDAEIAANWSIEATRAGRLELAEAALRIAMSAGNFANRAQTAARIGDADAGGAHTEAQAQVGRGRVVELEQTRSTPAAAYGLAVADFLNDAARQEVFDDGGDRGLRQGRALREIRARYLPATPNDVEHDRSVDLPHRATVDLTLDTLDALHVYLVHGIHRASGPALSPRPKKK
jgi:hypothetical protein